MEQLNIFVNFITEHWVLSTLFGVLLLVVLINEYMQRSMGLPSITPQEAIQLINHKDALVVDCRAESLFVTGYIIHSINVPMELLEGRLHKLKQAGHHPMILVCAPGQSIDKIIQRLKTEGFKELYLLQGGLRAWTQADLPLVKKS